MTVLRHIMTHVAFRSTPISIQSPPHATTEASCKYMKWVLEQQAVDSNFSNKIFFSDEGHFTLYGYVNGQNCRILCSENPQVIELIGHYI